MIQLIDYSQLDVFDFWCKDKTKSKIDVFVIDDPPTHKRYFIWSYGNYQKWWCSFNSLWKIYKSQIWKTFIHILDDKIIESYPLLLEHDKFYPVNQYGIQKFEIDIVRKVWQEKNASGVVKLDDDTQTQDSQRVYNSICL